MYDIHETKLQSIRPWRLEVWLNGKLKCGGDYHVNRGDSLTGFFIYPEKSLSFPIVYEIPLYRVWIPIVSCMKSYREWNLSYRVWNHIVSCILIYCAFVFSFCALNPFYRLFCEKLTLICCLQCNHFTSSLTLKIFCTQVWLYSIS